MKKTLILAGLFVALIQVHAATPGNASLSLQKDRSTDLFVLNMRDPQGIRSFSLVFPTDKLPYSGDLNGCSQNHKIDNIAAFNDMDFKPIIKSVIVDCRGGETEFEISAPGKDGVASVKKLGEEPKPAPPPPPAPPPTPSSSAGAPIVTTPDDLAYPVKELGNCASKDVCKTYCDALENLSACADFAATKGLLTKEEVEQSRKFLEIIQKGGPGGCKTHSSCEDYCNSLSHMDECVKFGEDTGYMSAKDLEEAKKVQSAIKNGKTLPGNCTNKAACELYCKSPEHMDSCIAFAKDAGLMSDEELKQIDKILPLIKSGQTPGKCVSKDECETYCDGEGHFDECVAFAEKAGLVSSEELEMAKKTGGKGPGGCKGKSQCDAFCEQPENQQACFDFGKEHGLIKEEDLKRMDEGAAKLKDELNKVPPDVKACVENILGPDGQKALESGNFSGFGKDLGDKMSECFQKMGGGGENGQGFSGGPGGCKSQEECMAYCKDHPDECKDFGPQGGGGGDLGGPSGGGSSDGFGNCGVVEGAPAAYVCAINGRGAEPGVETSYFNACHAKANGAEIIHDGVCKGHSPCSYVAHPVCGTDGSNYTDVCIAKEHGAAVKHMGICTNEDNPGGHSGQYQNQNNQGGNQGPSPEDIEKMKQEGAEKAKQMEEQYKQQYQQQYQQQMPTAPQSTP